jgi:hypothetical protein
MSEQKPEGQSENDWVPQTDAEKLLVRRELENILRHPSFLGSKRYPGLLRFVVKETLQGRGEQLKERTIGIEVFDREADYDSSQDNVVRATATEIRKRLAQYYANPDGTSEIRIALVAGSYIPKFFQQLPAFELPSPQLRIRGGLALLAVLILGIIGAASWWMLHTPNDPVTLFWRPIVDWNGPILLCMGSQESRVLVKSPEVTNSNPAAPPPPPQLDEPHVLFSSAVSLARLAGFLGSMGKPYRVKDDSSTSFVDLRSGPALLIGANQWAIRLTAPLRFSIKWDLATRARWISDRQNPSRRDWASNDAQDPSRNLFDYALISRFVEPTTGQWVVVTSGLHRFGTAAGAEFLCDREDMQLLAAKAPPGWAALNLQFVIETKIVQGSHGQPRILESCFWPR